MLALRLSGHAYAAVNHVLKSIALTAEKEDAWRAVEIFREVLEKKRNGDKVDERARNGASGLLKEIARERPELLEGKDQQFGLAGLDYAALEYLFNDQPLFGDPGIPDKRETVLARLRVLAELGSPESQETKLTVRVLNQLESGLAARSELRLQGLESAIEEGARKGRARFFINAAAAVEISRERSEERLKAAA